MTDAKDKLIVAIDVPTFEEARDLIDRLSPAIDVYKIGSQIFTACGPVIIRYLLARGKKVFLDLKFHDIPNTVANSVKSAVSLSALGHDAVDEKGNKLDVQSGGLFMMTLHTVGGKEMIEYAVKAAKEQSEKLNIPRPLLVGVTVLTSQQKNDNIQSLVLERACLAKEAGLDGVVASVEEAAVIRKEFGKDFVLVTPGIRPAGADVGDQKRVATPGEAIKLGSSCLVVGRPIVKADDPIEASNKILKEIQQAI